MRGRPGEAALSARLGRPRFFYGLGAKTDPGAARSPEIEFRVQPAVLGVKAFLLATPYDDLFCFIFVALVVLPLTSAMDKKGYEVYLEIRFGPVPCAEQQELGSAAQANQSK